MAFNRSTVLFAAVSCVLALALVSVVGQLLRAEDTGLQRVLGSADLSVPGIAETDHSGDIAAASALIYNREQNQIVFEQNGFERRSIASLTKLMTAMVALDHGIDWEQEADIQLNEYTAGGKLVLHPGETVTMRDLFMASLLSSANNATSAYVRQLGMSEKEFVQAMNRKAVELDLEQTRFSEPTGLDDENISTAYEVAKLAQAAFQYPEIVEATERKDYTFTIKNSGREHTMINSNKFFYDNEPRIFPGSKTGFIYKAGWCVVLVDDQDSSRIGVVLGSPYENNLYVDIQTLLAK